MSEESTSGMKSFLADSVKLNVETTSARKISTSINTSVSPVTVSNPLKKSWMTGLISLINTKPPIPQNIEIGRATLP